MPKRSDCPQNVKAFLDHGVDVHTIKPDESIADCPFCGKENHLYINSKNGKWDCKACGENGNVYTFLRLLWERSKADTTDDDFSELSEQRGIPATVLERWGVCRSATTGEWLLPAFNKEGKVINLHRWEPGNRPMGTTGINQHPFGNPFPNLRQKTVAIVEGPWDAMAWDSMLSRAQRLTHATIGLPGAGSCHDKILAACSGRKVLILLDNDDAGTKGTDKLITKLAQADTPPESFHVLRWPKDAPAGCDIRDTLINTRTTQSAYKGIMASLVEIDLTAEEELDGELVFLNCGKIEPREVEWLWPNRIPLGKITLLQGNPGLGKSYVVFDIVARITQGKAFPDGTPCPVGDALILSTEDAGDDTIVPRLIQLGADLDRVECFDKVFKDGKELHFNLARDMGKLGRLLSQKPAVQLIAFDPLTAYLGGKADSHKNADVRSILGPLSKLAEKHRVAIVGINHLNKSEMKAVHRGSGSIAFNAQARAVWQVSADPGDEDRRLFLPVKMNLAKSGGLAFHISDTGISWEKGSVLITADEAEQIERGSSASGEAKDWLKEALSGGPKQSAELIAQAKADGICKRTLDSAKKALGIESRRNGPGWYWVLPGTSLDPAISQAKAKEFVQKSKEQKIQQNAKRPHNVQNRKSKIANRG